MVATVAALVPWDIELTRSALLNTAAFVHAGHRSDGCLCVFLSTGICKVFLAHSALCQLTVTHGCVTVMQVMQQIMQMSALPLQHRLRTLLTASDILK